MRCLSVGGSAAAKFWFGRRAHSSLLRKSGLLCVQLLGILFSGSGSAGYWDFVDLEELGVRELLGSCAAVIVSSAVQGPAFKHV